MKCVPRVEDCGDVLAVFPFPSSTQSIMHLELHVARDLMQQIGRILATRDHTERDQEAALFLGLSRWIDEAAAEVPEGKRPWEITRGRWLKGHAPLRWVLGHDLDSRPPFLEGLDSLSGQVKVRLQMRLRERFLVKFGFRVHGAGEHASPVDERHDVHVAHAIAAGLSVPAAVMKDYPLDYWRSSLDLSWVLFHLDQAEFVRSLIGRKPCTYRLEAIVELGKTRFKQLKQSTRGTRNVSPGQVLMNMPLDKLLHAADLAA